MLRLLVRATRRVAGEQRMADGNMSEDAAGQARAPSPALRSEMSWSTPDRIMVRGFDLVDDLLGKDRFQPCCYSALSSGTSRYLRLCSVSSWRR